MSFSNTAETAILTQIAVGTATSWNGQASLWWALFMADPGEAGSAVTNESSVYVSYARVVATRATDFTIAGNQLSNAVLVQFPTSTGGSETITHAGLVTTASGAGTLIMSGALTSSRLVTSGIQPQFAVDAIVFTLD